jgi:ubiquitin carboxyl-terminal hydrolase 8
VYLLCYNHKALASFTDYPSSHSDMNISELKERTKDQVAHHARGVSALSLVNTARKQSEHSRTLEQEGDLKGAYKAVLSAAVLTKLVLDSPEFKKEEKKGVLWKTYKDFYEVCINDLYIFLRP